MDFSLTDDQKMIVETAHKVGADYGLDYWRTIDKAEQFPHEFWRAVCDAGLCGAALPEADGGSGLGMLDLVLIVEALAAGGGGSTVGQLFMINPIFAGVSMSRRTPGSLSSSTVSDFGLSPISLRAPSSPVMCSIQRRAAHGCTASETTDCA